MGNKPKQISPEMKEEAIKFLDILKNNFTTPQDFYQKQKQYLDFLKKRIEYKFHDLRRNQEPRTPEEHAIYYTDKSAEDTYKYCKAKFIEIFEIEPAGNDEE